MVRGLCVACGTQRWVCAMSEGRAWGVLAIGTNGKLRGRYMEEMRDERGKSKKALGFEVEGIVLRWNEGNPLSFNFLPKNLLIDNVFIFIILKSFLKPT